MKIAIHNWNAAYIVRAAALSAACIVGAAVFFLLCRSLADNFLLLFAHDSGSWVFKSIISFAGILAAFGIAALVLRPLWILTGVFFLSAVLYALVVAGTGVIWATAGIFFVLLAFFGLRISRQLKNQIKFSAHPLADRRLFLASLFALLLAVSFWQGYTSDAARRNYILPPELKIFMVDGIMNVMEQALAGQKVTPAQKQQALAQVRQKMKKDVDDMEKQMEPGKELIPLLASLVLFLTFQFVFWVLSLAVVPLVALLVFLLKKTRFVHEIAEKREVKYLTIE